MAEVKKIPKKAIMNVKSLDMVKTVIKRLISPVD
jgi:hypothetical protein